MPKGFFSRAQLNECLPPEKRSGNPIGAARCGGACKLFRNVKSPRMPPSGLGSLPILFIAEAPGEVEDGAGVQLVGPAGQVLRDVLQELGLDLDSHARKINAVNCRPTNSDGSNRTPEPEEVEACRFIWQQEMKHRPPKLVVLLGGTAIKSYWGGRVRAEEFSVEHWRGFQIPDHENNCWVVATYHPSYILYEAKHPQVRTVFKLDVYQALQKLQQPLPPDPNNIKVEVIHSPEEVNQYLDAITAPVIAFDYETTGIRPYAPHAKIVSCAISSVPGEAVAFLLHPDIEPHLRALLADPSVRKIAANLKFEHQWSAVKLGVEVQGWAWDTVVQSHVIDHRTGIHSLKWESFVQLGARNWSGDVDNFLSSPDNDPNLPNRIHLIHSEDLLKYNGIDAAMELLLALHQRRKIGI